MQLQRVYAFVILACSIFASGQGNGKLQLHFVDVGQGDSALVISPQGQTVLFDAGKDMKRKDCTKALSYLDQLGLSQIDYVVISHYHFDHIGCIPEVLQQFPLRHDALDRGEQYPGATYDNYVAAVGAHRKTAHVGDTITLDDATATPVQITIVARNGAGITTSNENDLSVTATVQFGSFRAEIGGDLSGDNTDQYQDIETSVAPKVGHIDVYKVHHHCSSHSTNDAWLTATTPTIGIVSAGDGNAYGHPTMDCLERLHKRGVKTYWTEHGNGGDPEPGFDVIGGNIIVQVDPGASSFSVATGGGNPQSFPVAGAGGAPPPPTPALTKFAWSTKSSVYHYANCAYVQNISATNRQDGTTPPPGKTLHKNCPILHGE